MRTIGIGLLIAAVILWLGGEQQKAQNTCKASEDVCNYALR